MKLVHACGSETKKPLEEAPAHLPVVNRLEGVSGLGTGKVPRRLCIQSPTTPSPGACHADQHCLQSLLKLSSLATLVAPG